MVHGHGIHWKAPTIMVGALAAGTAFAIGHHFFYQSLAGKATPSTDVAFPGTSLSASKQKVNLAIGTAFAFLFKACITASIGASYVQVFWRTLKRDAATIASVDTLYALLDNVLLFFRVHWARYWLLASLALIFWLVPIAAIVTPATLTVHLVPKGRTSSQNVSTIDFGSGNFAYFGLRASAPGLPASPAYSYYNGPQPEVSRIVMATLAQGDILSIPAPLSAPNASYTISFPGPALRCQDMSAEERNIVASRISASMDNGCQVTFGYLAWVPGVHGYNTSLHTPASKSLGPSSDFETYERPAEINFAVLPKLASLEPEPESVGFPQPIYRDRHRMSNILGDATMFQCRLQNESYHADFKYENGAQTVNVVRGETYNIVPAWRYTLWPTCNEAAGVGCLNFAYQAIMEAFGSFLTGSVGTEITLMGPTWITTDNTVVLDTVLGGTKHFQFLRRLGGHDNIHTLFPSFDNLSAPVPEASNRDLLVTVESLFQNITMSLMSSALFRPNTQSLAAPPPQSVTFTTYHNIYSYSAQVLWLSYGTAIGLATVIVTIGLSTVIAARASYSNDFSTVMRVTQCSSLSTRIKSTDGDGHDPLPKYIAESRISLGVLYSSPNTSKESVTESDRHSSRDEANPVPLSPPAPEESSEDIMYPQQSEVQDEHPRERLLPNDESQQVQ